MFQRKIKCLFFIFNFFVSVTHSQEIELKELTIYAWPFTSHSLKQELTKKTIKKEAKYILKTKEEWFPSGRHILTIYNELTEGDTLRIGHLDKGIRLLLKIKLKNVPDLIIYVNDAYEYEIDHSGVISEMTDALINDFTSFFYHGLTIEQRNSRSDLKTLQK